MENRRLRMFAGPNGSGKSTVFNEIGSQFDLGIYLNADELEKRLRKRHYIDLNDFELPSDTGKKFDSFIQSHSLYRKAEEDGYAINLVFEDNLIKNPDFKTHSYEASILIDFIRKELLSLGKKITFETVMSHPSKIEILKFSKEQGYKNYLYFISTESVEINKSRVAERVVNKGHPVPSKKIEDRYYRSQSLLREAIKHTYRTFIFDNSESKSRLILDIFENKEITYRSSTVPGWVDKYCLDLE